VPPITIGSIRTASLKQAPGETLPHWQHIAREAQFPIERLDPAFVQFVTHMGFPGSERLRPHDCLRTVWGWAERVKLYTEQNLWKFRQKPAQFENSEAYFRALCMVTVLQREFGVRYDEAKISCDMPFGLEDVTIQGIVLGNGGTCVSLPVLYASVGRRLGYPIKLVHAWVSEGIGHQFARWDGDGSRFNIETTGTGLCTPPDDHYRTGRYQMTPEIEKRGRFLVSETPCGELANCLRERGIRWSDLGNGQYAAEALAGAVSLDPGNASHEDSLKIALHKWGQWCKARTPPGFPEVIVGMPHGCRLMPDELPFKYELRIFSEMTVEWLLTDARWSAMWEKMRRGLWFGSGPTRAIVDYRTDGTRECTLQ
jgi:hypothetical protein